MAKGVAYTGVNIEDLKELPIPIPPLDEQIEITRRAYSLVAVSEEIRKRIEKSTRSVERSSQAVVAKAFRGGLIREAS
jgi:type I restriction enzyme, S subunit